MQAVTARSVRGPGDPGGAAEEADYAPAHPVPAPGPHEVSISVRRGVVLEGDWLPPVPPLQLGAARVPGGLCCGALRAAGSNVRLPAGVSPGARCVALCACDQPSGALAEACTADAALFAALPDSVGDDAACSVGAVASAMLLLTQTLRLPQGAAVLVVAGAGHADALAMVQVAAALGLRVIALAAPAAAAALRQLPCAASVTVAECGQLLQQQGPPLGPAEEEVLRATSGLGAAAAVLWPHRLAPAAAGDAAASAARCIAQGGTLAVVGADTPGSFEAGAALACLAPKGAGLHFHSMRAWVGCPARVGVVAHMLLEAVRALHQRLCAPLAVECVTLRDGPGALTRAAEPGAPLVACCPD
eukprot:TRINITY_DN39151_c0_g1_i1.p1 TRINITY_DN39151_c0_g1~~TRINITY_DN39151_c0_g1_i1.p1  ORF type:complete len:388 (+),score=108.79 TRINITY_DN39151_c0_g1_i1:87-1166(+)